MNRRQRRRIARLKLGLVLGPPSLAAALYLIGLLLPAVHRETEAASLPASAETLWTVLTDLDAMPSWRADLVALERLPEVDGVVRWREVGRTGDELAMERIEAEPPSRIVVRQADRAADRRWLYEISRIGTGARLRVTEERTVGNPIVRTWVWLFGSGRGRIEGLTRDLANRLAGHRQQIAGPVGDEPPGTAPTRPE